MICFGNFRLSDASVATMRTIDTFWAKVSECTESSIYLKNLLIFGIDVFALKRNFTAAFYSLLDAIAAGAYSASVDSYRFLDSLIKKTRRLSLR